MDIKLIAFDMDGTLLTGEKIISSQSLEVLEKCKQAGIKIIFATARSLNGCKNYIEQVQPDGLVLYGGALAYVGDEIVFESIMDEKCSDTIIKKCVDIGAIRITATAREGNFVNYIPKQDSFNVVGTFFDFSRQLSKETYKISFVTQDKERAYSVISGVDLVEINGYKGEDLYRISRFDGNKGCALEAVAKKLGIYMENVLAFGDDVNDIKMLQSAKVGVAMGNAVCELQKVAAFITDTNDNNGIAKWINSNLNI